MKVSSKKIRRFLAKHHTKNPGIIIPRAFLFMRTTNQSPRLRETLATVAITREKPRIVFSLVDIIKNFTLNRILQNLRFRNFRLFETAIAPRPGFLYCCICTSSLCFSFSSLKIPRTITTPRTNVSASATGWHNCSPRIPNADGRMKSAGIRKSPWRPDATSDARNPYPIVWVIMLDMTIQADSGRVTHWNRIAQVPISITSRSSFRNARMICGAPTKLPTARTARKTTETFTQNQKDSRTLSYRFAPKLKPQTGWNPCPNPIMAEPMNIIYLLTMERAAIAASPNGFAARFSAAVAMLAIP